MPVYNTDFDNIKTTDRPPLGTGAVTGSPPDGAGPANPQSTDLSDISGADGLKAIEALTGTGLLARTGTDTYAVRSLTAPAAGLTISNPAGVAGNPTFALANDLAALEALASTGYAKRTGTDTWSLASTVPWSDISATPTTLAGYGISDAQPLDADLTALAALSGTNTIYYRSAANTWSPVTFSGLTFSGGVLTASGGGGGSPGGSTTQIQFNDGGTLAGAAGVVWDKTNSILSVGTVIPSGDQRQFNVAGANGAIQLRRSGSASPLVELVSCVNIIDSEDTAAISYWDFYVNSTSSTADDFTLRRRTLLANENIWRASAGKLLILPTTASSSFTTGALVVDGGVGVAGASWFQGELTANPIAGGGMTIDAQSSSAFTTLKLAGTRKALYGVAGGTNFINDGSVSGDLCFRTAGNMLFSVDDGTTNAIKITASTGAISFGQLTLTTGLSIAVATKTFPLTINGTTVNVLCQ